MNSGQSDPHQPDSGYNQPESNPANERDREEVLESLLNQTRQAVGDDGYHTLLTNYVREHRLSSRFDFENLTELVRCVMNQTSIERLPVDKEEAINWVATCFYEDPVACERVEVLWNSIVTRIQNHD